MDLTRYQITHAGEVRKADTFGPDFLPELERVVSAFAPAATAFLEWGTGLSTMLFAEIAGRRRGTFVSIDHNADYAQSVISGIKPPARVRSLTADLAGPKLSQDDKELNYSQLPASLGIDFDFIHIDGRRRMECAHMAFVLSAPSTVVVLHDYRRSRYQAVEIFFEVLEDGPQFRVMRARPGLLAATLPERKRLITRLREEASR